MLQHLVAQQQVKLVGGKGQMFPGAHHRQRTLAVRLHGALRLDVQPHGKASLRRQADEVCPQPAAVHQHPPAGALPGSLADHLQPPLLPGAPHVRRFAPQGGFFGIKFGHGCVFLRG